MSGSSVQAQFIPVAIPIIREEWKALAATLNTTAPYMIDLSLIQSQTWIKSIRAIFIDGSASNNQTIITFNRTRQRLVLPTLSQGYLPILQPDPVVFTVQNGDAALPIQLLNFMVEPFIWKV